MEYRFCLMEKEKSLFFQLVLHVSYSSTRVCSWVIFLLPFLSTSVFILIKQMKTLIEAGNGGGLRWRGMLQEMYVTHWGCKSAWTAAQTVQESALSLAAGQNQVVMGCYSSWKRSRAGGDRWKLFSVLFQESKNIQALCASCWTGATKKSP